MFKEFLTKKGITEDAYKALEVEKQAGLHAEYLGEIETKLNDAATKADVNAIKEALTKAATKEEIQKAIENLEGLALKVAGIESNGGANKNLTFAEQIKKAINDNKDAIKEAAKGGKVVEFTIKAVADVTTASGSIPVTAPTITGVQQAGLSPVNLRTMNIVDYTTNISTQLSAFPYTEALPKEGDFAFLAEGGAKPQIDLKWETRFASPVKAAAWIRLTEEAVNDVAGLESIARDFLLKKHNLVKNKGILNGNGTSPNPKGATTYGRTFVAGSMASSVATPNFMDVAYACITDIATTHNFTDEMPYMANICMINPIDFYKELVSAKTTDGLPLYPTASLFNVVQIGGLTIIPEESIAVGKIFIADMTKYNTTNFVDYVVRIGVINDDFIKNQFVMLAESRFHAFVKKLDEKAFIYDDIATIRTAIEL